MPRRPQPRRGRRRLASPAQMERLRAVLGMQLPNPVPFENWRYHMRSRMNPEANLEPRLAAWEHANRPDQAELACLAKLQAFSEALHEAALASGTPPGEGEV